MKTKLSLMLLLCLTVTVQAAVANKTGKTIKITYENRSNDKVVGMSYSVMEISNNVARISTHFQEGKAPSSMPEQVTYLDFSKNEEIKVAKVNGEEIYTVREFVINDKLTAQPNAPQETIAGYKTRKTQTTINSNTLEVWYTTDLGVNASVQPAVAIPDGVVLKVVRNGQRAEVANKVEFLKEEMQLLPALTGTKLKASAFNYRIQQSQVLSYRVFDKESIYFRDMPKTEELSDTEVMRFASGTILLKKVKLPADNSAYSIFAELAQFSEGDAYDRTGSVFVIPTDRKQSFLDGLLKGKEALPKYTDKHGDTYEGITATPDYLPALELMRFYTSFGVKGYNHIEVADYNWPDSVVFKQEVTDYAKYLKNEVWVGAWIGNYAHNGHSVSLDIKYYPRGGKGGDREKEVYPIFTTVNIMEMAGQAYPEGLFRNDSLTVDFTTDVDLKDAYIRYISTGHGGWGGGDEFNPKLNQIFLDENRVIGYTPWREDCMSYRAYNPASGNFANGLSSSDLSRSGWCPGTVSFPMHIYIGDVKAGKHNMKVAIPVGDREGNSNSYWCISGAIVGDRVK